jgi:hypothetical protein
MKTDENDMGPVDERSRRLCQEFMIFDERSHTLEECWDRCFEASDCDAFYVDSDENHCRLYRKGCSNRYDSNSGQISTFGSCLMNRVALRQEFNWSTRSDGCFKFKIGSYRKGTKSEIIEKSEKHTNPCG